MEKTRRRGWTAITLALFCLLLIPATSAARPRALYWGAWLGDQLTGTEPPWDMAAVSSFEGYAHKGLSLIEFSAPFSDCDTSPCSRFPFPAEQMQSIRNYGAIPFFSWNSGFSGSGDESNASLAAINSGNYDSYIRQFAEEAREWGHPFFLRFNWEMNGNWFPWSEGINGNGPGEYVAAWRRVHDIFTSVGATNPTWVWCPYADASKRLAPIARSYPGDAYVDWTGLDGFNWGRNAVNPLPWRSFDAIFRHSYRQIVRKIAPGKPMVLAELASGGSARSKASWIRDMFKQVAANYTQIRGLVWFDQVDRGVSWPLETSTAVSRAFSRGIRRHPYRGNQFYSIGESPIRPPR